MITEVPDANEFETQGIAFLNLAWDTLFHLVLELADASHWHKVAETEVSEKYWNAAKDALTTSFTLAHQGTEFLLKANIAEVSPFLLLSTREWKDKWAENNTPYSEFYTVDAQQLVRLHNTVAKVRLSSEFREHFDSLRSMRNRIAHTIDRRLKVTISNVVIAVLAAVKELVRHEDWISIRLEWLDGRPYPVAFEDVSNARYKVAKEMKYVIEWLSRTELIKYFNFDKKRRRYICYTCSKSDETDTDTELVIKSAVLEPNTPLSTNMRCIICGDSAVKRLNCSQCSGNVIDSKLSVCLTCGEELDRTD